MPAGTTSPRWTTLVDEIRPKEFPTLKHKILGIIVPQDLQKMKQLESQMHLYPHNNALREEFNDQLLRSSTAGLMQVTEYHEEERSLGVRTTTAEAIPMNYLFVSKQLKLPRVV